MSRIFRHYTLSALFLLPTISLSSQANHGMPWVSSADNSGWVKPAALVLTAMGAWWVKDSYDNHTPLQWNWKDIRVDETEFPPDFYWGASTSSQQIEGGINPENGVHSNWSLWEYYKSKQDPEFVKAGKACNFWHDYKPFITLLKKAGLNSFRMSLEWARIEPEEGKFDQDALNRYQEICKAFYDADIKLFVTLHHYTEPLWFSDTDYDHGHQVKGLGGFSRQENIKYFARYAEKAFRKLNLYVHKWATFNNLTSYASKAYHAGLLPPAKRDMQLWQETQAHMLQAHVQAYKAIKDTGKTSSIGIMHNVFHLEPWRPWHPFDRLAVHMVNLLTRDGVYSFFGTGRYTVRIPGTVAVDYYNPDAPRSLDWIGCNNYSHAHMKGFSVLRNPSETLVDNKRYTLYPEGIYRAIKEISATIAKPCGDIPIIVTENGVSTSDPAVRKLFFERYLYAINRTIQEGCKVQGYLPWSLIDNYEWGSYKRTYGLYKYTDRHNPNSSVTLREGISPLLETVEKYFSVQT